MGAITSGSSGSWPPCRTSGTTSRKGDPDYQPKLDRDNDGLACEG
ncbi:excalibur calcium-binding domain-containing protein [Mycobacterium sp.]